VKKRIGASFDDDDDEDDCGAGVDVGVCGHAVLVVDVETLSHDDGLAASEGVMVGTI
jgi:hypothetical protein